MNPVTSGKLRCTPTVDIGPRRIGRGHSVYVIAEAGVNHNGDVRLARDLIHAAKEAGADAVKFQLFTAERLVADSTPMCGYQSEHDATSRTQRDLLRKLELPPGDWTKLRSEASAQSIDFLATPFGLPELGVLTALQPPALKIASPDLVNVPLLVAAANTNLPLLVSTGAATMEEVETAVRVIRRHRHQERLILLHCVSAYPTPTHEARLACIRTLESRFDVPVGFSDHTMAADFSALAVAAGACVLEKHLTLSRQSDGPDHFFSLEPNQFATYVTQARQAWAALGSGAVHPSAIEMESRTLSRGSLVTVRSISAGSVVQPEDLAVQRPADGIEPLRWNEVIGSVAKADIPAQTRLHWSMLSHRSASH